MSSLQDNIDSQIVDEDQYDSNFYSCRICVVRICGIDQAEAHCDSAKHIRKVRISNPSSSAPSSAGEATSNLISSELEFCINQGTITENNDEFTCIICNTIGMFGAATADSHLKGKKHLKVALIYNRNRHITNSYSRLENQSERSRVFLSPVVSSRKDDSPYDQDESLIEEALRKEYLTGDVVHFSSVTCELCKTTMTGDVPLEAHLKGKSHCKKDATKSFVIPLLDSASSTPSRTDSRQSSTTTLSLYDGVASSDAYEAIKRGDVIVDEAVNEYRCTICNTSMTGVTPLQSHLEGKSHQKKAKNRSRMTLYRIPRSISVVSPSSSSLCLSDYSSDKEKDDTSSKEHLDEELIKLEIIDEKKPIKGLLDVKSE